MKKRIKLIPFNKDNKYIEGVEIELESRQDILKDFVVISCKNKSTIERLKMDIEALQNDLKLNDKLIIFNYYENPEDKIEFFILQEDVPKLTADDNSFIL
jgi:hypothetical protein